MHKSIEGESPRARATTAIDAKWSSGVGERARGASAASWMGRQSLMA